MKLEADIPHEYIHEGNKKGFMMSHGRNLTADSLFDRVLERYGKM